MSDCLMCDVLCKERDEHWDAELAAKAEAASLRANLDVAVEEKRKAEARVAELEGLLRNEPGKTLRTESDLLATWNGGWNCCLQDLRRRAGLDKLRDCPQCHCERWETPE